MNFKNILFTLAIIIGCHHAHAQFSLRLTEPHILLKQSMEHYEYGHFTKSKDCAKQYLSKQLTKPAREPQGAEDALHLATANFYLNLSCIALKEEGAMSDFALFLAEIPFASLQQYGYFKMAKSLFSQQSFAQAIPFYEKANINYLSNQEITQRNFELAYCYLLNNQLDKVDPLFASIKDVKGEYFSPGNYYHGVLAYYRGDYDGAIKSFEAVREQKEYENIVPFYIAELNYFKGNKDESLKQALNYMKNAKADYYKEMSQLAGQIYYERNDFENAQKYLSNYVDQQKTVRNSDYFRMGYVKYQNGEFKEAANYFKQVKNNETDMQAQSLYYLGLCHLKNGEKESAYSVFKEALKTNKLDKLTEDIKFNTAKLSYDLEGSEVTDVMLDDFLNSYPQSKYFNDAAEMQALLNVKLKNFEKAISSLQKLENLSPIFQALYQKVNYALGIQLLKEGTADLAVPFFTESAKYPINENLLGLAEFWNAECYYRLGQYSNALSATSRFINNPGEGNSTALIRNAYLTNAYVYMHQNDKEQLKISYMNYLDTIGEVPASIALSNLDSIKPNYVPSHIPLVEANPYVFIYQLPSQQVDFVYKPLPLTPMAFNNSLTNLQYDNSVKLGIGNFRSTQFQLGYDLRKLSNNDLYLSLNHRASKSSMYLQQASNNTLRLTGKRNIGDFKADGAVNLSRDLYRPFGGHVFKGQTQDIKNRFVDFNIMANATPIVGKLGDINYKATTGVGVYNINSQGAGWSGSELSLLLDVPFSKNINETTDATIGIEIQANGLVGKTKGDPGVPNSFGTTFLSLKPSVRKTFNDIELNVGLFPVFGKKVHLLPNISASKYLDLVKAKVALGVEGALIANSYKQLSQGNPYIGFVDIQQSKRMLFYAQIFGAIYDNFNYNIKAGAGNVKNLPLFINDTLLNRSFDVWYEKSANIFSLQANVEYHLNYKTNAGVQINYEPILSATTYQNSYNYVALQLNAYAKYSYNQRLNLRSDLFMRSGTKSYAREAVGVINLNGAFDLNLTANYKLTNNWHAFAEVNNIFNNKYQRWFAYPNYGINAIVGFVYSFKNPLTDLKINEVLK